MIPPLPQKQCSYDPSKRLILIVPLMAKFINSLPMQLIFYWELYFEDPLAKTCIRLIC